MKCWQNHIINCTRQIKSFLSHFGPSMITKTKLSHWGFISMEEHECHVILQTTREAAIYLFCACISFEWNNGWNQQNVDWSMLTAVGEARSWAFPSWAFPFSGPIFSSPVRRTESYSDTPGVSVSVSVKMLKFLVQVISFLMFLSTTLFFTDYNIQIHILL